MRIARNASKSQTIFARRLRADQTDAERVLWRALRSGRLRGMRFRRQQPLGRYIIDFYCHEAQLVIELDGGQHLERVQVLRDHERDEFCRARGIRVLRFYNDQVLLETDRVLAEIDRWLSGCPSP